MSYLNRSYLLLLSLLLLTSCSPKRIPAPAVIPPSIEDDWEIDLPENPDETTAPSQSCHLKEKTHDIPAFLDELTSATWRCVFNFLSSEIIKSFYSDPLYHEVLARMAQFNPHEISARTNYLRLSNYFLLRLSHHLIAIPKDVLHTHHLVLKRYTEDFHPESFKPYDPKPMLYYEEELIDGIAYGGDDQYFVELLSFLQDRVTRGLESYNQFRALDAITWRLRISLYDNPTPSTSIFFNGVSNAFLEWYATLYSSHNKSIRRTSYIESQSFSRAAPTVFSYVKQKLLEHIDPKISFWDRLWVMDVLVKSFKTNTDLKGNKLDLEAERRTFVSNYLPNTLKWDHVTYHTRRRDAQTHDTHLQLLSVQDVFMGLTRMTTPVKDDKNDELKIMIMDNPENFIEYIHFFEGVPPMHGLHMAGFFIERMAIIYSYEKEIGDSDSITFLEDVLKHEYTHYLTTRYMLTGVHGESDSESTQQILWFEEGFAEFLSAVDRYRKIQTKTRIIEKIKSDKKKMPLSKLLQMSSEHGYTHYCYAYAFVYFLYAHHPSELRQLIQAIAQDSYYYKTMGDNSIVKILGITSKKLTQDFHEFLNSDFEKIEL